MKGQPISWPCLPYFHEETGEIIFSASIAFPVKALNIRRHPQVSLLFSDASGSNLNTPDGLLIQGDASVEELTNYQDPKIIGLFHLNQLHQPDSSRFTTNRVVRRIFPWYLFQRLIIRVGDLIVIRCHTPLHHYICSNFSLLVGDKPGHTSLGAANPGHA